MSGARLRWALAAAMVTTVGGVAACGASTPAARTTVTGRNSAVTVKTGVQTTTAATTSADSATVTTTGTDTTADLPGTGMPTVLLGDMNTPEQFIIGAMYQDALQAQGYHVDLSRNIGPTTVSEAAIAEGSLDIYPEYLNVYDTQVADNTHRFTHLGEAFRVGQRYANAHAETLLTPTPFSDTAGIAVLSTYARLHHLTTMVGLRRLESTLTLTLGSPLEFSANPEGLAALERAYRFTPDVTAPINIGAQYDALRAGTLQAAYVQTTDWELSIPIYTDLRDTKHVLGFGNVVPVVSSKVLDTEGPAFASTINTVDALLTTQAMRGLAAEMERSPDPALAAADVAQEFLQGYGILPAPPWSTVTTTTPLTTTATTPGASGAG